MLDALQLYRNDILRLLPLPTNEQALLALRAQTGDKEARNRLVAHSQALLLSVVYKCAHGQDKEVLDLIQEANFGLLHAIDLYNPAMGAFSTYAVIWMRRSIQKHLQRLSHLSLPGAAPMEWAKIKRVLSENGHAPAITEIAQKTGLTTKRVAGYQVLFSGSVSFGQTSRQREDETIGESVTDSIDVFAETECMDTVAMLLSSLSEQQRTVFLLIVFADITGKDVAKRMKLTQQRVSQIYLSACASLRQAIEERTHAS